MIFLKIIAISLLVLLSLILLVILIPFTYLFKGNSLDKEISMSLSWLSIKIRIIKNFAENGKLTVEFLNFSKVLDKGKQRKKKRKTKKKKKSISFNRWTIEKALILIKKIWISLKPKRIYIDARVGFTDPMQTGIAYGLYHQLTYAFLKKEINIEPVFDGKVVEGKFEIKGRAWLIYLLIIVSRFFISLFVRNKIILKMKRKGGVQHVRQL